MARREPRRPGFESLTNRNNIFFAQIRATNSPFRDCLCRDAKIRHFEPREENERRIVNESNYPNTSHDITDSDILLESRIEKMNVRDKLKTDDDGQKFC